MSRSPISADTPPSQFGLRQLFAAVITTSLAACWLGWLFRESADWLAFLVIGYPAVHLAAVLIPTGYRTWRFGVVVAFAAICLFIDYSVRMGFELLEDFMDRQLLLSMLALGIVGAATGVSIGACWQRYRVVGPLAIVCIAPLVIFWLNLFVFSA